MNRPDWMPDNPHKLRKGYVGITDPFEPRVLLERGFDEGSEITARKLLEYLIGQSIKFPMKIGEDYLQCVVLSQFVEILKQLEEKNV
jgi:hypothetical protein